MKPIKNVYATCDCYEAKHLKRIIAWIMVDGSIRYVSHPITKMNLIDSVILYHNLMNPENTHNIIIEVVREF